MPNGTQFLQNPGLAAKRANAKTESGKRNRKGRSIWVLHELNDGENPPTLSKIVRMTMRIPRRMSSETELQNGKQTITRPAPFRIHQTALDIAARCSGVVPQQPPTMEIPMRAEFAGELRHVFRSGVVTDLTVDHSRRAGIRLEDGGPAGRGGDDLSAEFEIIVQR